MATAEVKTGKRGRKAAIQAAEQTEPAETPKPRKDAAIPKTISFFQRLADIATADWGTRAKVTIYRLEPLINALVGSEKKYIKVYTQPPVNEERIKQDCGSGRYRLYLNFKAPAQNEREVDSVEIDILDLAFPPKVPKGSWLDDPRNSQWAWAKEAYDKQNAPPQQQQQPQAQSVLETLDTMLDVAERMNPKGPAPRSATEELSTLVTVAEKLRPNETVPQFVQVQFTALQAEIAAARERSDKLMMMLIDRKQENPGGLGVVKELVGGLKDILPSVKDLFPGLAEAGAKSRLGAWQELTVALAPHVSQIVSPFSGVIAQVLMMKMTQNGQQPHQPQPQSSIHNPAALPAGNGTPATMMPFLQMVAMPMMNYIRPIAAPHNVNPTELGTDFASWVYDGFGAHPNYEQAMMAAKSMGPVGMIAAFRSATPLWIDKGPQANLPSLQELEPRLMPFFQAFLSWNPDEESDEEPAPTDPATPDVLNFDEKYAGAEA